MIVQTRSGTGIRALHAMPLCPRLDVVHYRGYRSCEAYEIGRRGLMHPETHGAPEVRSSGVAHPGSERRARPSHHLPHSGRNPFAGPLSAPLWEKAHRVPSAYPDTFDYGMYDRLYERFGAQQPRGGVVYKGTMKLLEAQDCA